MEKNSPCSAYKETRGLVFFARMLDKIRLKHAEQLHPDYFENLGQGFDGRCRRFLGVGYPLVRERTLAGGTDEEILDWCLQQGSHLNEEQIFVFSSFLRKRGWRDDDTVTKSLEDFKAGSGLAHRSDIVTFFDFYEVDEGRRS
jgi:gluconokinase